MVLPQRVLHKSSVLKLIERWNMCNGCSRDKIRFFSTCVDKCGHAPVSTHTNLTASLCLSAVSGPFYRGSCTSFRRVVHAGAVRWYSTGDERNKHDEDRKETTELKGLVVHLPSPLSWIKNKWNLYNIKMNIDPAFNLDEFLLGAKQALTFLTRLIVQKDLETLATMASDQVVETVKQMIELWPTEKHQSIEIVVDDISLISAYISSVSKQKGIKNIQTHDVYVDVFCIAIKRFKTKPLLVQMTVRFHRVYGKTTAGDWLLSSIQEFGVKELAASRSST